MSAPAAAGSRRPAPSAAFPFASRFARIDGHRIHYVEAGSGDPVLFLHGQLTWSYLWRNVLPGVARGTARRAIAMDLLGFGRSDKPDLEYDLALHERMIEGLADELGLGRLVLVGHDWGGIFAARYAVRHPERVAGLALIETPALWDMTWEDMPRGTSRVAMNFMRTPLGGRLVFQLGGTRTVRMMFRPLVLYPAALSEAVLRAYEEPFRTPGSRKAMRTFPSLIPINGRPAASSAFFSEIGERVSAIQDLPVLMVKPTPGMVGSSERHVARLRAMLPHLEVKEFGPGKHFIQEDDPERLVALLSEWIRERVDRAASRTEVARV